MEAECCMIYYKVASFNDLTFNEFYFEFYTMLLIYFENKHSHNSGYHKIVRLNKGH